ncbi:MAG: 30S ribosomal protein S4 [Planctomycetes bacterium]|nr:30S ribosomal protein S4 [Planctomycetota bacterium]
MAVYHGPACRLCRREGEKLFLKGVRCDTIKCPFEGEKTRTNPPGQHTWRKKPTDYGLHLRESQKMKRLYGILDKQFRRYVKEAGRMTGNSSENLVILLERRLDNIVYRAGLALSRRHARQIITHGQIRVNGRKVTKPSYQLSEGDEVSAKPVERINNLLTENLETRKKQGITAPSWVSVQEKPLVKANVLQLPSLDEASHAFKTNLVIEYYSK